MEIQRPKVTKKVCKRRINLKDFTLMSRLAIKLQESRQCGTNPPKSIVVN